MAGVISIAAAELLSSMPTGAAAAAGMVRCDIHVRGVGHSVIVDPSPRINVGYYLALKISALKPAGPGVFPARWQRASNVAQK